MNRIFSVIVALAMMLMPVISSAQGVSGFSASSGGGQGAPGDYPGVYVIGPTDAFGNFPISELTPVIQHKFSYDLNPEAFVSVTHGTGSVTHVRPFVVLDTGAAASGAAEFTTKQYISYATGQGIQYDTTFVVQECSGLSVGSFSYGGLIDEEEGWAFGCSPTQTFGTLRRSQGQKEIAKFTITTGSSHAESVTVTLDGETITCSVSNSASTSVSAAEVGKCDYTGVDDGWYAEQNGSVVRFINDHAEPKGGAYSIVGTSIVAAYVRETTGVVPVDVWRARADWNMDPMDGKGPSKQIHDETKGNVMRIMAQWLGFGAQWFGIENGQGSGFGKGMFAMVDRIDYANANTQASVLNPSFPIHYHVSNAGNAENVTLRVPSLHAGIQGKIQHNGRYGGKTFTKTGISTEVAVLTVRNNRIFSSVTNKAPVHVIGISIFADHSSGKETSWALYRDATLGGTPSWETVNANNVADYDTSGTTVSGGTTLDGGNLADATVPADRDYFQRLLFLGPGESVTIAASTTSGTTEVTATINFETHL